MAEVKFEDLLGTGAHFGHVTRKWDPNFKPYILLCSIAKIFVFLLQANIIEKLIQNKVILKSLKKEPPGKNGIKLIQINVKLPI